MPNAAGSANQPWSNPFEDAMPVWPHLPGSPVYGDSPWDLNEAKTRISMGERYIRFTGVPAHHRTTVKNILMALAAPDRDEVVEAGVIRRGDGAPPATIANHFHHLATIVRWSEAHGLVRFSDWTQEHADQFLDDLRSGEHRKEGVGLAASTIRQHISALRMLRECSGLISDPLPFYPWGGRSATEIAGETRNDENSTPPLPWETWAPLVAASWVIVDRFSVDIIAAAGVRSSIPKEPRGPSGNNAFLALSDWSEQGGALPLHTGHGRKKDGRGEPNTTLLQRLLGINATVLKRSHHQFMPEAVALIEQAASDPDRTVFGGLYTPTVEVEHADGTSSLWVEELGLGETEYLVAVLRGACYVLITSLTGMRDGELQELTRETATTKDGLPALRSIQHKGNKNPDGVGREWWAPRPVIRTVEVLSALSEHDTHLFARDTDNAGTYVPTRDIARLLDFVNDDPTRRPGRGRGPGLAPIPLPRGLAIHATSLRRSFSVYATTHPGAELGLGIQLGHAAWRMTSGYMSDGQQQAVRHMDADRKRVLHNDAAALISGDTPIAGPAAHHITQFRAQVIADPDRADRLAATLADRLHLGLANDCMWNPATSGCGTDRPQLGDHVCVGLDCTNALARPVHLGVVVDALDRIDAYLDEDRGHPDLIERMRRDRANLARIRRDLTEADTDPDDLYDDLDEEPHDA
ncbi:hypothetical protein [Nocardioides xinjiangensis]|uniref:hypothetical protein n=1 Tax=Nocardioides xinjiangensis TaxID=2817376 RepID=UPI001B318015|nr:hypothetical protein [Nocardioides sp. SYSU D00514]